MRNRWLAGCPALRVAKVPLLRGVHFHSQLQNEVSSLIRESFPGRYHNATGAGSFFPMGEHPCRAGSARLC